MGFRQNLLQKIEIDKLARKVSVSVVPPVDALRFDKKSMRGLLDMGSFPRVDIDERGLELYILENDRDVKTILVLDNGLGIYRTTVDDVALRKSPTIKEMLSIRNAIKILNDKDVLRSKREISVQTVQQLLIQNLDLTFDQSDIAAIADDGAVSLESGYMEGVLECLALFGELLDYRAAPRAFQAAHHEIIGARKTTKAGEASFGPMVIYDRIHNSLKLIEEQIAPGNKGEMDRFSLILKGKQPPAAEGPAVFAWLKATVMGTRD